jgi:hypothetical protein
MTDPTRGGLFRIFRVYSRLFVLYNYAAFPVKPQARYAGRSSKTPVTAVSGKRNFHFKIQCIPSPELNVGLN